MDPQIRVELVVVLLFAIIRFKNHDFILSQCFVTDKVAPLLRVGVGSKIHLKYIPRNLLEYLMASTQIHGILLQIGFSRSNTVLMIYMENQRTKQLSGSSSICLLQMLPNHSYVFYPQSHRKSLYVQADSVLDLSIFLSSRFTREMKFPQAGRLHYKACSSKGCTSHQACNI